MMRYDPTDLDDFAFVVGRSALGPDEVADIIGKARLPDSEEVLYKISEKGYTIPSE